MKFTYGDNEYNEGDFWFQTFRKNENIQTNGNCKFKKPPL